MWNLETSDVYARHLKHYTKKHPRELRAVLDNLNTYLKALQLGAPIHPPPFGFLHAEPHGVWAIDQKGGGKSLAQTRLYVYPAEKTKVLHLLALGDKNSQKADIQLCNQLIAEIQKSIEGNDEPVKTTRDEPGEESQTIP